MNWERVEALVLCQEIEKICPKYGCHVALTGGLLYKEGKRKDCDILFYRIRQAPNIDMIGLMAALDQIGMEFQDGFGWCYKFTYHGKKVDAFFPEEQGGNYADEVIQNPQIES